MLQEKVKALVNKQKEKGDKKNIENLVVFLIILIVTIIAINTILKEDNTKNEDDQFPINYVAQQTEDAKNDNISMQESLENKLKNILCKIEGVGKTDVLVTYSTTSEVVAMYNENTKESSTEEADSGGGTRKIIETDSSKEVIYKDEGGSKIPVTTKTILPKLEGAIIIAEGAKSAEIKANIIQAVEAATGLATHKIQVFTMQI